MGAEKGSEDSWGGGPAPPTSVDVGRLQPSPSPRARVSPGLMDGGGGHRAGGSEADACPGWGLA